MYELPPILRGGDRENIAALRDYLVRLSRSLEDLRGDNASASGAAHGETAASSLARRELSEKLGALRALIVKTADSAQALDQALTDTRQELREGYLARSDFGEYMERAEAGFAATARGVVESYDFQSALETLSARAEESDLLLTSLRGEIRRGLIHDPDSGETVTGIAIAENLRFTGSVYEAGGLRYYELAPGQTLGLYTASGWQFWVGGVKRGWFDARDGRLHVAGETVEDRLQLGGWVLLDSGGLGVKVIANEQ